MAPNVRKFYIWLPGRQTLENVTYGSSWLLYFSNHTAESNTLGGVGFAGSNILGGVGFAESNTLGGVGFAESNTLGGVGFARSNTLGGVDFAESNTLGGVGFAESNTLGDVQAVCFPFGKRKQRSAMRIMFALVLS